MLSRMAERSVYLSAGARLARCAWLRMLRDSTGEAPAWSVHESAYFVIPAIFRRESIPDAMDARQKTAGMTDRGGRFMSSVALCIAVAVAGCSSPPPASTPETVPVNVAAVVQ